MATGNILAEGNTDKLKLISVTLSPALIVLNTTAEQTFTVPGLAVGDWVFVNKPTAQAGLGIVGCRVTAANTLGITFSNNTGSSITPKRRATSSRIVSASCAMSLPLAPPRLTSTSACFSYTPAAPLVFPFHPH